ncbi:MAG: serine hydrolase [Elusimicrobiota bacterium]
MIRRGALLLALLAAAGCASPGPGPQDCRALYVRQDGAVGLTNPLLDLELGIEFRETKSFRNRLEEFISQRTSSGTHVSHISIYFRDLNNGPWFGVNSRELFSPASLFKVPIMMAILKEAESFPGLLSARLTDMDPEDRSTVEITPGRHVEKGRSYSVEELLELMIARSDNRAHDLLLGYLDRKVFDRVFLDLGVKPPDLAARDAQMNVKEYATFFRILYNASYLGRDMSRRALEFLVRSEFDQGLAAGLPPGTMTAHKFGERAYPEGGLRQLHDCGIIYHPRTPYVLCVMTRGEAVGDLVSVLRDASALVWRQVDAQAAPR